MAVDKRIPRVLNSDVDSKTINKVSMLDALNVYSGPDNEGLSSADGNNIVGNNYKNDSGNGVLKNIRGTEEVFVHLGESLPVDCRVIGSVEDVKTDITYFFVYSNDANNQGVWAYDKNDVLNTASEGVSQGPSIRLIYKSNQFNFPQNGFVKADIVYTNASKSLDFLGDEFDKDVLLYFTDGINEPRKLNTYRAFVGSSGSNIHGDNIYAEADFICACPRVPLDPITFSWDFSDETRSVSNFSTSSGFKFAYQYIYKDGTESAISPYSDVAFPPSVLSQGAQTYVDHSLYNRILLSIPSSNINEVDSIRLMAKEGFTGSFGVIEEIKDLEDADFQEYYFYNDRISRGVNTNEVNKQFDSVPRSSVSQSVTSNRLMYGNYVDGFDNVETSAIVEAVYKERGQDFKTFDIKVQPSIASLDHPANPTKQHAKTVGFVLDCSGLPNEIIEGTVIDFKLTIAPDQNWHLYDFIDGESYHQSKQLGPQDQQANNTLFNNANVETFFHQTEEEAGAEYLNSNGGNVFGLNTKVNDINYWNFAQPDHEGTNNFGVEFPSEWSSGSLQASVGTSAGNPLIFKGAPIVFKARIRANYTITSGPTKVAQALRACLTLQPPGLTNFLPSQGFSLAEEGSFDNRPSYSYDLNIQDGDIISQPYSETSPEVDDFRNKLICSVKAFTSEEATSVGEFSRVPIGHFIVNRATLQFYCEPVLSYGDDISFINSDPSKAHLRIGILSVEDAETVTCVHEIPTFPQEILDGVFQSSSYALQVSSGWIAITRDTVIQIINNSLSFEQFLSLNGLNSSIDVNLNTGPLTLTDVGGFTVNKNYLLQLGFLDIAYAGIFDVLDGGEPVQGSIPKIRYCLMDGEGGPGGGPSLGGGAGNAYDDNLNYLQGSVSVQPIYDPGEESFLGVNLDYNYGETVFYTGSLSTDVDEKVTCMPLLIAGLDGEDIQASYPSPFPSNSDSNVLDAESVNYNLLHPHAEIKSVSINVGEGLYEFDRSFKTEANHDFGIVYYDQRGRHGFVNHLDTVFIDGYSSVERGSGLYGPANVRITINHDPPEWAHHYKIVYSGNTTVSDFVQYTTGGAFAKNAGQEISDSNSNIYVSLNYLQGHPVSYVSAFGARTPEGGLNLYKFEPGDKMRLISYGPSINRTYPADIEFDVVDLVKLGDTDNPLVSGSSTDVPENKKGDFVILKNNPNAFGFTFEEVASGTHFWDQNAIFELRTPEKERNIDELVYYEIGETYNVVTQDGVPTHEQQIIDLNQGDVWFRPVAANVKNQDGTQFIDIIGDIDGVDDQLPDSNFVSVLMETKSASDLFRSDNSFLGRPNVIFQDSSETRRESTITYSEPTNPEGLKVNYSNFNASLANFKDLSERYGGIQYMGDHSDYVVVIQKERVTIVPVNKNLLSDAAGSQQIIASTTVLNEAIVYPGASGCDDDPSSVYDSGDQIYFCNKSLSKVYKWTKNGGAEDITAKGMSSFIRACIQKALDSGQIRVVGGYDPLKQEYLLSIQNLPEYGESTEVQPVVQPPTEAPGEEAGGDVDEGGDDVDTGSELPPLVVIPDPIVFNNTQFGPGAQDADGSLQSVSVLIQANQDLNIEDIQFSDDRFTLTTLTGAGSTAFPIPFIPSQGFDVYPIVISYSPDTVDEVSAEIEFITNLESHPSIVFDIDATATFVAGDGQALPDEAFSLAEAFNDYYNQTYTAEDMSAQLAIEYLQALAFSPVEDQPTGNQIKLLLNSVNQDSMKRLVLDTYGDNNNAVGDSTDGIDFINLIGANGVLGDTFDPNISIFQDNETFSPAGEGDSPPPLSNNPPPNFETVEEAVQYLEQNKVLRVHDIVRLNKYSNPNIVLNVTNRFGTQIINTQELVAILAAFGTTLNGMDSPYASVATTDYDTAEYTGSQVIDQIVTEFYDVITVEQYHRILNDEYPDPSAGGGYISGVTPQAALVASTGAYSGYFGADYDYSCQTPTLLFFLGQFAIDNGITLDGLAGNPEIL